MNEENKRSIKRMLSGRALYIALGVCVLAAGIVGFSAVKEIKTPSTSLETTTEKKTYTNINEPDYGDSSVLTTEAIETTTFSYELITQGIEETESEEISTQAVFEDSNDAIEETYPVPEEYSFPLKSMISKDYSMGVPVYSSTMADYRTHNGVDFKGAAGESVQCIAAGTVISVTKDEFWGNTVEIDHGGAVVSSISGLADEGLVSEGTFLDAGAVIGVVGTIPVEAKDGEHIHLEIRVNGEICDPVEIMGIDSSDE